MKLGKITFADLPVAYDCVGGDFVYVKKLQKCGNMDALLIKGTQKGQIVSFILSSKTILDCYGVVTKKD